MVPLLENVISVIVKYCYTISNNQAFSKTWVFTFKFDSISQSNSHTDHR